MHNSLRLAAVLLSVCILTSCGNGIKVGLESKEYQTDGKYATFTVPTFEDESEFVSQITDEIEEKTAELLDNFIKSEFVSKLDINTEVTHNDGRVVSVVMEGEVSGDKPHGEKLRIARTYDFEEEKVVALAELFMDDSWQMLIDNKMRELVEGGTDGYDELWEIPTAKLLNKENFYIKDGELVIYFPPYELSYYRRGYVEFNFTPQELARVLSDYGKQILYI